MAVVLTYQGTTKYRSVSPPLKAEFRAHPANLLGEIIANGLQPESVTAWLAWLRLRGRTDRTLSEYGRVLTSLSVWLAARGLTLLDATSEDIHDWRAGLTVAETTVNVYVSPVTSFYAWAHKNSLTDHDPAEDLPRPKWRRRLPRPIADDILEEAIAAAPPRIRIILVLAAYAGLRAQEIAYLHRESILNTATPPMMLVTEDMAKGGRERTVPLSEYVWSELCCWGLPRRGIVIPRMDDRSGPCTPQRISQLANTYLHDLGIVETLHQLRHRFGTATYGASRDLRVVQELMGHSSPVTTAGYAAFSKEEAVDAVTAVQPRRRLHSVTGPQKTYPPARSTHR